MERDPLPETPPTGERVTLLDLTNMSLAEIEEWWESL